SRYLAADHHAAVAVFHDAIADDDVLAGSIHPSAVVVPARFDRDAVVAGIEITIFDQDIPRRFRIAAIAVGSVADHLHAPDGHVLAKYRVHDPHRRVPDGHILDQHIPRVIGLNKVGPQIASVAKNAFLNRNAVLRQHFHA